MIQIKLDKATLPNPDQKVKWQTYRDHFNEQWKFGVYSEEDSFFVTFDNKWDSAFNVMHWEEI